MNKLDLVEALKEKEGITKNEAATIVDLVFDEMSKALAKGNRVEIRGLCSFRVKKYSGYHGKNPKTGDMFRVKPKKLPYFKCGTDLKKRVNTVNSSPARSDGFQSLDRDLTCLTGAGFKSPGQNVRHPCATPGSAVGSGSSCRWPYRSCSTSWSRSLPRPPRSRPAGRAGRRRAAPPRTPA